MENQNRKNLCELTSDFQTRLRLWSVMISQIDESSMSLIKNAGQHRRRVAPLWGLNIYHY